MKKFFKDHAKLIIIITLVALLLTGVIIIIVKVVKAHNDDNSAQQIGISKIAELDGDPIPVFDTEVEANNNPISTDNFDRILTLKKSGTVSGSFETSLFGIPDLGMIISDNGGNKFSLSLSKVPLNATMLLEITIGGEESFVAKRLTGDSGAEKYYVALAINTNGSGETILETTNVPAESETTVTTDDSGTTDSTATDVNTDNSTDGTTEETQSAPTAPEDIPNGRIFIGEDTYMTYSNEAAAQRASETSNFTIPSFMIKDGKIKLTADPNDETARVMVIPCMLDNAQIEAKGILLDAEHDWTSELSVQDYEGHQLTLMLKYESGWGITNTYQFVSFNIPDTTN